VARTLLVVVLLELGRSEVEMTDREAVVLARGVVVELLDADTVL